MIHWVELAFLVIAGLLLLVVASCVADYVGNGIGWDLYPSILRSRKAIRRILKARGTPFRVESFGATRIDPDHLCICINVNTDAERDSLQHDDELIRQFRKAILSSGYPAESVPMVSFSIESQETVSRDFEGNWFYARK
jgi:hypothetical protein